MPQKLNPASRPFSIDPRLTPTFLDRVSHYLKFFPQNGMVYFPNHRPLDALDGKRLRGVIDEFKALRLNCNTIRGHRWSSTNTASIEESRDIFEHHLCEMLADYRCFLEAPLFLAYYRASAEFHHDRFFQKMGQALKRRTAPHGRDKRDEALWIAAQREAGIAALKVTRSDGSLVSPEADMKLLKRHNVKVQRARRQKR